MIDIQIPELEHLKDNRMFRTNALTKLVNASIERINFEGDENKVVIDLSDCMSITISSSSDLEITTVLNLESNEEK